MAKHEPAKSRNAQNTGLQTQGIALMKFMSGLISSLKHDLVVDLTSIIRTAVAEGLTPVDSNDTFNGFQITSEAPLRLERSGSYITIGDDVVNVHIEHWESDEVLDWSCSRQQYDSIDYFDFKTQAITYFQSDGQMVIDVSNPSVATLINLAKSVA